MEHQVYRVLIADDEYWTRQKLCGMIDWPRYSLECMTPAENGQEVLNKLEHDRPDILVTDINMPFVSGVELLKIIHEKYPDIVTFVVSGYSDFEYVKETFISGSINYLMKPVTKIDLVNALTKAMEIISTRQASLLEQEQQRGELLRAASSLEDREYSQLLQRDSQPYVPGPSFRFEGESVGMSLMLIKLHDMKELTRTQGWDMNTVSYAVKKRIRECFPNKPVMAFNHIYRPNEFAVISELSDTELSQKADEIIRRLKPMLHCPLTVMISGHNYSVDSIHNAYVQNVSMLMTRVYVREDTLLVWGRAESRREAQDIPNHLNDGQIKEFKTLLQQKKVGTLRTLLLDKTGLSGCAQNRWQYIEVKQLVKRILNVCFDTVNSTANPEEVATLENLISEADKMVERLDVEQLCDSVMETVNYVLSIGRQESAHSVSDIVRQAVTYVDEHYYEELSLSSLAEQFGVESSYFSKTFRQATGENLMLYIMRKRMERAGEYIRESDISLTEIAFMTGYDDYSYFNRVFRKIYGMSPREYRNQARHASEGEDGFCEKD